MNSDVYICGCSFSTGFYAKSRKPLIRGKNTPYPEIFCKILNRSYTNLAFNGASNYAIAKQVEYAITLHPKLIIVNVTTPMRIDWTRPEYRLTQAPTLKDIVFNDVPEHPLKPTGSSIRSLPISSFIAMGNPDRIFIEYVTEYVDPYIKADSDRLLVLGMLSLLTNSGIPFIVVNFSEEIGQNIFPGIHDMSWKELADNFSISTDEAHFNQVGHLHIATKLVASFSLPKHS
jgi:hypothetical protein